jgi:hypothetical protein
MYNLSSEIKHEDCVLDEENNQDSPSPSFKKQGKR